jgi:hypothetical protein
MPGEILVARAPLNNNHTLARVRYCGAFLLPNGHEPLGVRLCFVSFASFALLLPLLLLPFSAAAAAEKSFEKSFETLTLTPASTTRHGLWQAGPLRTEASLSGGACISLAPSSGWPRPISRSGRAGRPYRPWFRHMRTPPKTGAVVPCFFRWLAAAAAGELAVGEAALGDALPSCRGDTRPTAAPGHIWAWSFKRGVKPDGVIAGGDVSPAPRSDLGFSRVSQKGLDFTVSFRAEPVSRGGPSASMDELPFGDDDSGLASPSCSWEGRVEGRE